MAITVNQDGQVLQNGQWVTTDQSDEFKAAIDKAKQQGATVNENTTFAIVEKGDWLFKIADQYGVNGSQLAYKDNKQFADNPDLIYAGEAVAVNGGNAAAGDEPGNPAAGTPTGESSAAVPNQQGYQQMLSVLSDKNSTSAQRQAALEAYLSSLTPEQRQAAVTQIKADLDADRILGPVFDRPAINRDIDAVAAKLNVAGPGYADMQSVFANPASTSAQRQAAATAYLTPLTPEQREAAVARLKSDLNMAPNMCFVDPVKEQVRIDMDSILGKLNGTA